MIVHDATPSIGSPTPESLTLTTTTTDPRYPRTSLGRTPEAVWEWLRQTPVWPRLTAGMPNLPHATLDGVGHAHGWQGGEDCIAVGLPVVVAFDVPTAFNMRRQSWDHLRVRVAVNEDGTRGAVVLRETLQGADDAADVIAEGDAFRAGGGVPDID